LRKVASSGDIVTDLQYRKLFSGNFELTWCWVLKIADMTLEKTVIRDSGWFLLFAMAGMNEFSDTNGFIQYGQTTKILIELVLCGGAGVSSFWTIHLDSSRVH
jgi:hypothetical protein